MQIANHIRRNDAPNDHLCKVELTDQNILTDRETLNTVDKHFNLYIELFNQNN